MKNLKFLFAFFALNALLFAACDKDDDDPTTEQEVITTVQLQLTPEPLDTFHTYTARDVDGPGGNAPEIDELHLTAGQVYTVSVKFLDESNAANPLDLTPEVLEESVAHLVCFETTGNAVAPTILDMDANGKALGILSSFTPTTVGTGTLQVSLKHEPDKDAASPCSTGETDVEVTFDVTIE